LDCRFFAQTYLDQLPQVEMHPQWQQEKLRAFCQRKNIHVTAWAPIGAPGTPYGVASVLDNPILKDIAEKHKKIVAQAGAQVKRPSAFRLE
jgi:diketogulonate reductase-like aldo/keto reductase